MPNDTIKADLTIKKTKYEYCETKRSKNRGIDIWIESVDDSRVSYEIDPNPHENTAYNKNGQAKFYEEMATSLAKKHQQSGKFPSKYAAMFDKEKWSLVKK